MSNTDFQKTFGQQPHQQEINPFNIGAIQSDRSDGQIFSSEVGVIPTMSSARQGYSHQLPIDMNINYNLVRHQQTPASMQHHRFRSTTQADTPNLHSPMPEYGLS